MIEMIEEDETSSQCIATKKMFSGHTFRKSVCKLIDDNESLKLTAIKRETLSCKDGRFECEVSEIDSLFPPRFPTTCLVDGNLCKNNRWQSVVEQLEEKAITKSITYNRSTSSYEKAFKIPVLGYNVYDMKEEDNFNDQLFNHIDREKCSVDKMVKENPHEFFFWEGAYYNINYLYKIVSNNLEVLKKLCPLVYPLPELTNKASELPALNQKFFDGSGKKLSGFVRINHKNKSKYTARYSDYSSYGWTAKDHKDFLEVRFCSPVYVSHIGTLGGSFKSYLFPRQGEIRSRISKNRGWVQLCDGSSVKLPDNNHLSRKCATCIRVAVDDEPHAWVSSYSVSYRERSEVGGNKWIDLGTFVANSNAVDEVIVDLRMCSKDNKGLFATAIRIKPLTFKTKATMRICMYGFQIKTNDKNILSSKVEEVKNHNFNAVDIPTIDYVLSIRPPIKQKQKIYVKDGNQCKQYRYYSDSPLKKRIQLRSDLIQSVREEGIFHGIDDIDDDDDGDCKSSSNYHDSFSTLSSNTYSGYDDNYDAFYDGRYSYQKENIILNDGSSYNFLNETVPLDWPTLDSDSTNMTSSFSSNEKIEKNYLLALTGTKSRTNNLEFDDDNDENEYVLVSIENKTSSPAENCSIS